VRPNQYIYEHLAEAYALHGQSSSAMGVLGRMAAAGLQPEERTYKRLLHGLGAWGDLEAAVTVYQKMTSQVRGGGRSEGRDMGDRAHMRSQGGGRRGSEGFGGEGYWGGG
jgi:pentatricopeptide repeat protein